MLLGQISSGCSVIRNRLHFKRSLYHARVDVWRRLETVWKMIAMSAWLREEMIKIGSDCAQFSHPPPARHLRLLDHYECTGRTQWEPSRVSEANQGCEKEENQETGGERKRVCNTHKYECKLKLSLHLHINENVCCNVRCYFNIMWLFCVSVLSVVMLLCSVYPSKGSRCSVSANGDPHKILNPKSWWMLNRNALCFEDEPLSLTVNRLVVKYVCYSQRAQQLTITFIKQQIIFWLINLCLSLSVEKNYFVFFILLS